MKIYLLLQGENSEHWTYAVVYKLSKTINYRGNLKIQTIIFLCH